MTVTVLKIRGHIFGRMSFSLGLRYVFLQLDLGYASVAASHTSDAVLLVASYQVAQDFTVSITLDNYGYWIKMAFPL